LNVAVYVASDVRVVLAISGDLFSTVQSANIDVVNKFA